MKKLSFLFLTIGIIWGCWAESPKREFRATWLASVSNIDWPKSTQTSEEQKAALIKIFDGMQFGCRCVLCRMPCTIRPTSHGRSF